MNRHIVEVFKQTSDEWCPNYPGDTVKVSYRGNINPKGAMYRVCAWGDDDLGMEFDHESKSVVWQKFIEVISLEDVTFEKLKEMGFVSA